MITNWFNTFFTPENLNDLTVGFVGFAIEVVILSVLIPIIVWFINRPKNNRQKFVGHLLLLKALYNITLELAFLFELDKEDSFIPGHKLSVFNNYWFKHASDLKITYSNHDYYKDLEAGLYCLIHAINRESFQITQDKNRLTDIIQTMNNVDSSIDRSILINAKDSDLVESSFFLSTLCKKILEYLKTYKTNELTINDYDKSDFKTGMEMIVFSILAEFYTRKKVVDKDYNWWVLRSQFSARKKNGDKPNSELILNEFRKEHDKEYDKDFARGQFLLLINIIMMKLGIKR